MRLTKKSFQPNLEVKVNKKSFSFANAVTDKLEGYHVTYINELEVYINKTKSTIFKEGDILITHSFVNYRGSQRCIFTKKGEVQLYQAFWCDFSKLTDLI